MHKVDAKLVSLKYPYSITCGSRYDSRMSLNNALKAINRLLGICYTAENQPQSAALTKRKGDGHSSSRDYNLYKADQAPLFTLYNEPYALADLFSIEGKAAKQADTVHRNGSGGERPGAALSGLMTDKEFWRSQNESQLKRKIKSTCNVGEIQMDMIRHHFLTLHFIACDSYEEAVKQQYNALSRLLDVLGQAVDNLMLPLLHRFCYNYYHIALAATSSDTKTSQERPKKKAKTQRAAVDRDEVMNTLGSALRHAMAQCSNHKSSDLYINKRWGALRVITLLFKVAFKINNQRLGDHALQVVNSPRFPAIEKFPLPDRLTYHYYNGKFKMLKNDFPNADESLSFALRYSPNPSSAGTRTERRARKERIRLILDTLVPIKLYRGYLVDADFLRDHNCEHYIPLVRAMKTGDIGLYERAMEEHQNRYIRTEVYLVLCELQKYVFRRLVKRTALLIGGDKIDLEYFHKAFAFAWKRDVDLPEVECILANLIHDKLLYAIIYHKHTKLVMAQSYSPFPAISSIR
eukprot:gb/GECG01010636.1/.p1 GENE.gb/GECG01010636.1/~~gb/GECG01010636.1/.p1  ORF type:complete len:520 (+),score=46.23 gb/GECG01010636.1/:1-1560(+)